MPPTQSLRGAHPSSSSILPYTHRPTIKCSRQQRPAQPQAPSLSTSQPRPAKLLRRPKRPYTFTQMITLSDGSTFTHRTTSPLALYKSTKDIRNNPLWNPSNIKLSSVESDEAGRLRAFRRRFGRGWDARSEELGEGAQEPASEAERDIKEDAAAKMAGTVAEEKGMGVPRQGEGEAQGEAVTVEDGRAVRTTPPERGEESEGRRGRGEKGEIRSESGWSDEAEENLMDLIGGFGISEEQRRTAAGIREMSRGRAARQGGKKK